MTSPPQVWLNYRPLRIGWAVNDGCLNEFDDAVRLSCCLWGGRFNPILPAHNSELANNLVGTFGVDLIIPIADTPDTQRLTDEFQHLIPGIDGRSVFQSGDQKRCLYADVYHPARRLYEQPNPYGDEDKFIAPPTWDTGDPLGHVLLAMFGGYPDVEQTGLDYRAILCQWLKAEELAIRPEDVVDPDLIKKVSPLGLSTYEIVCRGRNGWRGPGVVIGDGSNLDDLILFWNLRAANAPVWFYDTSHGKRLRPWVDAFLKEVQKRAIEKPAEIAIWSREMESEHDLVLAEFRPVRCGGGDSATWNGHSVKPPKPRFNDWHIDVIPAYSETADGRSVSFPLPQKPFYTDDPHAFSQRFVVSASVDQFGSVENDLTFTTPFLPRLNEFYGRNFYYEYNATRSERGDINRGAVGLITDIKSQRETVHALKIQDFLESLFELADIKIKASQAGLICSRLISQLGGVQGCRVLKVRGARELIQSYEPDQSFTRSAALQMIGNVDPETNQTRFSDFEDLYIERRDTPKLKPEDVFVYLVTNGVFRVGLDLKCPNCLLTSWLHIDDVKAESRCEYCGTDFDITPQLRDRDWRYRRSGLFGRRDNQQGSIPVALTIQQLDIVLRPDALMYSTALEFQPKSGSIEPCEADFVMLVAGREGLWEAPVQVLIGECKTTGPIEAADARKLGKLADAIDKHVTEAYIMFAKTGTFSSEEIEVAKSLNLNYRQRVILWSQDELEPYFVYKRSDDKLGPERYASSLSEMAAATGTLFFSNG